MGPKNGRLIGELPGYKTGRAQFGSQLKEWTFLKWVWTKESPTGKFPNGEGTTNPTFLAN